MRLKSIWLVWIIISAIAGNLMAGDSGEKFFSEQDWALGMSVRIASIPFATEGDKSVGTVVPLFFYYGDRFYLRGIEAGYKFYKTDQWQFTALGRRHFFDIPKEYQNVVQGDNVDWGLQAKYQPYPMPFLSLELLSDWEKNVSSNIRLGLDIYQGGFHFDPYLEAKIKSRQYNSYYYGLNRDPVKGGIDFSAGIIADYQLLDNFYMYGAARITLLDKNVRDLSYVNSDVTASAFLGIGFGNDRSKPRKERLSISPYIRVAHGWATPSDLANIIRFQAVRDTANNQLTSIFYGYPLADEIFSLPIDFYLTGGFLWHWANHVQRSAQEIAMGIKLYITIPWPIRWRFGAAEGLSYVNRIPYVEKSEMERKGYVPSNLLNYLDFSVDLNLGDIFGGDTLKKWWFGYSIHHRSAIFESAQQFGRISGGSNFQTLYVQVDL